jgi:hypothetical protein
MGGRIMEKRKVNIMINKVGGNASKNALNYRISLPSAWMKELNVTANNRSLDIIFDKESRKIILEFPPA